MEEYNTEQFEKDCKALGVTLSDEQIRQFLKYFEMLVEWNEVMNLTAITEYDEVMKKHFVDSISLCKAYDVTQNKTVIDVGTGAGFPGLALKIAFPNLQVTLLDSLNKRINFLNEVISALGLTGVETIHVVRRIMPSRENAEKNMIFVYPGQWQIFPHCQNIAFLL